MMIKKSKIEQSERTKMPRSEWMLTDSVIQEFVLMLDDLNLSAKEASEEASTYYKTFDFMIIAVKASLLDHIVAEVTNEISKRGGREICVKNTMNDNGIIEAKITFRAAVVASADAMIINTECC